MLSIAISMSSYALFVVFAGGAALRDASGDIADVANGTISACVDTEEVIRLETILAIISFN